MRRRRVIVLGATGSIGESAFKVANDIPDRMEIVGVAAQKNVVRLAEQANFFGVASACVADASLAGDLRSRVGDKVRVYSGDDGLVDLVKETEADMVLVAIVGTAGLRPALAAIDTGKDLAIASKEILVMAGEAVMQGAAKNNIRVLPVDSEHNAIFQCLEGRAPENVRRLILTASGGPFRTWPAEKLRDVVPEQALKHPTWEMGRKITIDSATLFNKGLEMIEAHWLFGVGMEKVDVVVHPQSIVHSMVEFVDSSILAQLSHSDMCFPIQYAVTWPDRVQNSLRPLDFREVGKLEFEAPRWNDFPALNLAKEAGTTGGTLPAVLNAANEVAVAAFLDRRCGFPCIWETVAAVMQAHRSVAHPDLNAIIEADAWARKEAASRIA